MFCRNCGKELIGSPEICPNCGARPMRGNSFCSNCGASTTPLTEICPKCGVQSEAFKKQRTARRKRRFTKRQEVLVGVGAGLCMIVVGIAAGLWLSVILGAATLLYTAYIAVKRPPTGSSSPLAQPQEVHVERSTAEIAETRPVNTAPTEAPIIAPTKATRQLTQRSVTLVWASILFWIIVGIEVLIIIDGILQFQNGVKTINVWNFVWTILALLAAINIIRRKSFRFVMCIAVLLPIVTITGIVLIIASGVSISLSTIVLPVLQVTCAILISRTKAEFI